MQILRLARAPAIGPGSAAFLPVPLARDSIEDLGAAQEHRARAGQKQHVPACSRIKVEIPHATRGRAYCQGIDDRPRLPAGLDDEQSGQSTPHHLKYGARSGPTAENGHSSDSVGNDL